MRVLRLLHKKLLSSKEIKIFGAESCTGGLISSLLTQYAGSSGYFVGSIISYSNDLKTSLLGVSSETLEGFGAVSREVVHHMLEGCQKELPMCLSFAVSGIAGPGGGTETKPVGLVYLGVRMGEVELIEEHHFSGNRARVRKKAAKRVLFLLLRCIEGKFA